MTELGYRTRWAAQWFVPPTHHYYYKTMSHTLLVAITLSCRVSFPVRERGHAINHGLPCYSRWERATSCEARIELYNANDKAPLYNLARQQALVDSAFRIQRYKTLCDRSLPRKLRPSDVMRVITSTHNVPLRWHLVPGASEKRPAT